MSRAGGENSVVVSESAGEVRPCLIIPTYNNRDTIFPVLGSLEHLKLPCIVLDDGSNAITKAVLQQCERRYPWVTVIQHSENRGKGAAVMTAAQVALGQGFTHAVQIDADGQHDVADVKTFLAWCRAEPEALILGKPIFDGTAPRNRIYGRKLTNVCIWFETLSFAIKDGICGFRCYPLEMLCSVSQRSAVGRRMDFDPGIVVRMAWEGATIINVETRIRYFEKGVSHFKFVRDNVSMVRLHINLMSQLLFRLPSLLKRRAESSSAVKSGTVIPLSQL